LVVVVVALVVAGVVLTGLVLIGIVLIGVVLIGIVLAGIDRATVVGVLVASVVSMATRVDTTGEAEEVDEEVAEVAEVVASARRVVVDDEVVVAAAPGGTETVAAPAVGSMLEVVVEVEVEVEAVVLVLDVVETESSLTSEAAAGEFCSTTTVVSAAPELLGLVVHQSTPPRRERQTAPTTAILDFVHPREISPLGDCASPTFWFTSAADCPSSGASVVEFGCPIMGGSVVPNVSLCVGIVCAAVGSEA
jgi:hypothetical protein